MKTTKLEFSGGFHNSTPIRIRLPRARALDIINGEYDCLQEAISEYQYKKLDRHFCGIEGCTCGGVMRATIEEVQQ